MPEHRYIRWFDEIGTRRRAAGRRQERLARRDVPRADRAGRARAERLRRHGRGLPRTSSTRAGAWRRAARRPRRPGHARRRGPRRARRRAAASSISAPALPEDLEPRSARPTRQLRERVRRRTSTSPSAARATAEDLPTRQLRRPAGDLPQRPAATRALLDACRRCFAVAVHRPRDLLPRRQGLRPLQGRRCRSACRRWSAPTSPPPA